MEDFSELVADFLCMMFSIEREQLQSDYALISE